VKCPYCAEAIKDEAIVCLHCHRDLTFFKPIDKRLQAIDSELKDLTEHVSKISEFLDQQQTGGTKEGETAPTGKLKKPTKWRMLLIVVLELGLSFALLTVYGSVYSDLERDEKTYYDYYAGERPDPSPTSAAAQSTSAAVKKSDVILQPNSLCARDERIIFSCRLDDQAKIGSVCASKELAINRGYLQYRFGRPGEIELEYPKDRAGTQEKFQYSHYSRPLFDLTRLRFVVDGDEYQVLDDVRYVRDESVQGVRITSPDGGYQLQRCTTQPTIDYGGLNSVLQGNEAEALTIQKWEENERNEQQQFIGLRSLALKIFVAALFLVPIALGLLIGLRWQGKNLKRYVRMGLLCGLVEGGIVAIIVIYFVALGIGGPHWPGKFTFPLMFAAAFIIIDLFRCVFGFATGGLLGDWIERRRYPQLYGRGFSHMMALKLSKRRENLGRFGRVTHGLASLTSSVAPLIPLMGVIITSVIGFYTAQAARNAKIEDNKAKAAAAAPEKAKAEENEPSNSKPAGTVPASTPQPSGR
jgi:hypothetical protein